MNSFIPWVGGKSKLLWIINKMAPDHYSRFIDVFGGSGTVTMSRPIQPGCMEVYNDFNSNLTNLFCCVKNRPLAQLEKNYGKEGSEIIQDNCQDTIFGGFAPNSQTAEVLSKALGNRTVLSGSVSRGKNDPSQSLQMMERPLLTPDELKSIPKGNFIVQKTGQHPMRTRLRLFLEWGITFEKPYIVSERADRAVAYANREDLERNLPQSNKAENADMRGAYAVSGRGGIAHEPAVDKPRRRGGKQMKTYGEEDL